MYHFYVLKSLKTGLLYKEHSEDVFLRLRQHDRGTTRSTRSGVPWVLAYCEDFTGRADAVKRERYFKSLKGGKELRGILGTC